MPSNEAMSPKSYGDALPSCTAAEPCDDEDNSSGRLVPVTSAVLVATRAAMGPS